MDGQVNWLVTVHPLLTLSFVSTWILPLHVVSSTLKRKSSSSVMDGLQRRRRYSKYITSLSVLTESGLIPRSWTAYESANLSNKVECISKLNERKYSR